MDISDFTDSVSVILPPYSKELTLNHDQRDITIEFSTLDFDNTSSVRFMYKLDGYDSEWRYCGVDAHEVSYNNLSSVYHRAIFSCNTVIFLSVYPCWRNKSYPLGRY